MAELSIKLTVAQATAIETLIEYALDQNQADKADRAVLKRAMSKLTAAIDAELEAGCEGGG
jgi:phage gp36-like protein